MEPRENFGHMVKRELEELCSVASQPATKKVKKESTNLDSLTRQEPNDLIKNVDTKCKLKKELTSPLIKQEQKFRQGPNDLKRAEDTKCNQYAKLEKIQNSTARNLLKEEVVGNINQRTRNVDPLYEGMLKRLVSRLVLYLPHELDMQIEVHSRWEGLTEEETFRHEIWRIYKFPKPSNEKLDLFWRNLSNDLKVSISKHTNVRRAFYKDIRKVVDRRLNETPNEDVLYAFATYFRESHRIVKFYFPDMTRQEVYDTCLLRYFAKASRERKNYENQAFADTSCLRYHTSTERDEIISTREESKKLCSSRFGNVP